MTSPHERIAIAIGNFAHAMETNNAELRLETREALHALFAELAAERDHATTARDGWQGIAAQNATERDRAIAERDAALHANSQRSAWHAQVAGVLGIGATDREFTLAKVREVVAERDAAVAKCSFLDQLPKGPALGRFSASERAELDELKRKAFKAGEP